MIINPIIPIWAMLIICVFFLVMKRKGIFNYIRQIIVVLLMFAINLRPTMPGNETNTGASVDVDVLFVVDNTISMLAEDYNGDGRRIDAVKEDCRYIVEQLNGVSFSVVTFDNSVKTMTPYTIDTNITTQVIDILNGQSALYAEGTTLNNVLDYMEGVLDRERDAYQVVFFISDGEITKKKETLGDYSHLAQYIDTGAVLGYGTKEGGAMKVKESTFDGMDEEYLYYYDDNYNEKLAISKLDEENLGQIASDLDIEYIHMTNQANIDSVLKEIKSNISVDGGNLSENYGGDIEYYYYLVIPLVLILIYDFLYYRRRIFRKEK